jgi:DNA-binding NarL/FixJ family response regulator
LKSSDYYGLFVDTVPDDIKKLYTEAGSSDFNALSQTAHRLKGVFAMLNLLPGKQLCESLEQHIADGDALKIENNISQIDFSSADCWSKVANNMNNLNVIIADDHPIVLFGIRKSLEQIEWVNVVGEFEDSTALINNLSKLDANVLITDLSMPGDKYGDGITLIKYIKRHYPQLSIIVLTMNNNPAILSAVLDLDIEGIVLKQGAPTDLPKALAALQKGKKFTPESVSKLLERISASGYGDKRLSPKESEVLRLFARRFPGDRDRQEAQPQHQNNQ